MNLWHAFVVARIYIASLRRGVEPEKQTEYGIPTHSVTPDAGRLWEDDEGQAERGLCQESDQGSPAAQAMTTHDTEDMTRPMM